ncbi:MAG: trypsin-like peptidase domain-containing protein [Vulcanimicrobiaceae bacterium]|jgi:S1-C subfamily serine protease
MRLFFSSLLIAVALVCRAAIAADDASIGYAKIKPSLVKIWALDGNGKPIQSGTGFVVASDKGGSLVLTSAHTVLKAAKIVINIPGQARDIDARLKSVGPVDTAMLKIDEPNLTPVRFVAQDHVLHEGSYVAVAGFLKNDESIEIAGLVPRVLYPGTISSLPSSGRFLDLANLNIEEGLSGSPVFEPRTGEVVGMIDTRDTNRQERGGYAISAPLVLNPFFEDQKVRVAYENSAHAVAPAPPAPVVPAPAPPVPAAPAPAFPSSAFVAAEPQPNSEPAEPLPQSQPPQQVFHQVSNLAQSDFTVQTSWITQRPDVGANVLHVRLNLHPSHDMVAQAGDFQISVPSPNGGMQTIRARALSAGPGEVYGPRKQLSVAAGETTAITANFVVPQDAQLTADAGRNVQWVAAASPAAPPAGPQGAPPATIADAYGFALLQTPRGILVQQVAPNSLAQKAGLQPGDIITSINGQRVTDAAQARQLIASSPEGQLNVAVHRASTTPRPVMATAAPNQ